MRDSSKPPAKGWPMGARCLVAAALAVAGLGLLAAPAAVVPDPLPPPVINTTVDQSLGDCSVTCSLRDAIALSAAGATLAVPAGHYVLTLGDITITQSLTLAGAGARTTVIDGNSTSGGATGGIFNITSPISVELDDLSLINGVADQQGGAISSFDLTNSGGSALTIRRCTIANNQVTGGQAGGVAQIRGLLFIEDSTISNNSSFPLGGSALLVEGASVEITNSTITGNSAPSFSPNGAVLIISGQVAFVNDTITANPGGKGLSAFFSLVALVNDAIAENPAGDCRFVSPVTTFTDHSLDSDNSCGLSVANGDLPGVNPLLGTLANHGGMTDTVALLGGSPAINAGDNANCPPTDQRGVTRPQGPACDIGADEDTLVSITVNNASVTVLEGQTAVNGGTVHDADGDPITLTASVGTVVNNGDGTWSWSLPATDPAQSQTVTITATTDDGPALASSVSFDLTVLPPSCTSASASNFNGTPIAGGDTIWFNAVVAVKGIQPGITSRVNFAGSTVRFTAGGTAYDLAVPNATIVFSPAASQASTTYDAASMSWTTTVPASYAGKVFLSGLAFAVPAGGLPGGTNPVTWSGGFTSDAPNLNVQWQWAAAVYTQFATDYNAVGVKPIDGGKLNPYPNSDHAGTPENDRPFVTGGARGGGGSNFTGSYSGTHAVVPCPTPLPE